MNDSAIKSYCTWARRELILEVERRCAIYDISENPTSPADTDAVNGRVLTAAEKEQRKELLGAIREEGYDQIVERAAYTWFNRIMAIRFMEVNDRLPSRTRMFSANDGGFEPQILNEALSVEIEGINRLKIAQLVQDGDDEITFRYLFLAQCHELAKYMPDIFEKVDSAMEILLPDGLLRAGGVLERIVTSIDESDWTEGVEIVGWMYQYYVSERHDAVYESFGKGKKAERDSLAPATQLFTPDWIVSYLTENSLGRLWLNSNRKSLLISEMEYYVNTGNTELDIEKIESPESITIIDPACGSGHILVYAFDILAKMYEEYGYSRRDIPSHIIQKNLYGLEIDNRAAAMASFALTMKACEFDSRFLRKGIAPNIAVLNRVELTDEEIFAIERTRSMHYESGAPFLLDNVELLEALSHLDECGSLYEASADDLESLICLATYLKDNTGLFGNSALKKIQSVIPAIRQLSQQFSICIANPPYLGSKNMNDWLKDWVSNNYPDGKRDLCTCFLYRCLSLCRKNGYASLITMQSWLSLDSYKKLREFIIGEKTIISMAHMGTKAFDSINGEVVATTATCFYNHESEHPGVYIKLTDLKNSREKKTCLIEAANNVDSKYRYVARMSMFKKISGSPISAYWITEDLLNTYLSMPPLSNALEIKQGLSTCNNDMFMRLWWEVSYSKVNTSAESPEDACSSHKKWFPYNKGGEFRKWYGNNYYIVNWENNGLAIHEHNNVPLTFNGAPMRAKAFYFREGLTWSTIANDLSMRYCANGHIFDAKGSMCFTKDGTSPLFYAALLNSSTVSTLLGIKSLTLDFHEGQISQLPDPSGDVSDKESIEIIAARCIGFAKHSWDSFEASWDFEGHPFVIEAQSLRGANLRTLYSEWKEKCSDSFNGLRVSETQINTLFTYIYHTEQSATIDVPVNRVSATIIYDKEQDIPIEMVGSPYAITQFDVVK